MFTLAATQVVTVALTDWTSANTQREPEQKSPEYIK